MTASLISLALLAAVPAAPVPKDRQAVERKLNEEKLQTAEAMLVAATDWFTRGGRIEYFNGWGFDERLVAAQAVCEARTALGDALKGRKVYCEECRGAEAFVGRLAGFGSARAFYAEYATARRLTVEAGQAESRDHARERVEELRNAARRGWDAACLVIPRNGPDLSGPEFGIRVSCELSASLFQADVALATDAKARSTARSSYLKRCRDWEVALKDADFPARHRYQKTQYPKLGRVAAEYALAAPAERLRLTREYGTALRHAVTTVDSVLTDWHTPEWTASVVASHLEWVREWQSLEFGLLTVPQDRLRVCKQLVSSASVFEEQIEERARIGAASQSTALRAKLARLDAELRYAREAGKAPPR